MSDKESKSETTPDQLMEGFRGRGMKTVIVFTILAHAVLLLGTSVPFLMKKFGAEKTDLSAEQVRKNAMLEATESLREIATEHGLNLEDLTSQFSDNRSTPAAKVVPSTPKAPTGEPKADPTNPESPIEAELGKESVGPALPEVGGDDEDEDLFK